jgi:hypothetical protein
MTSQAARRADESNPVVGSSRKMSLLQPSGHAHGGTQITLICIAIGSGSPTAKTIH